MKAGAGGVCLSFPMPEMLLEGGELGLPRLHVPGAVGKQNVVIIYVFWFFFTSQTVFIELFPWAAQKGYVLGAACQVSPHRSSGHPAPSSLWLGSVHPC